MSVRCNTAFSIVSLILELPLIVICVENHFSTLGLARVPLLANWTTLLINVLLPAICKAAKCSKRSLGQTAWYWRCTPSGCSWRQFQWATLLCSYIQYRPKTLKCNIPWTWEIETIFATPKIQFRQEHTQRWIDGFFIVKNCLNIACGINLGCTELVIFKSRAKHVIDAPWFLPLECHCHAMQEELNAIIESTVLPGLAALRTEPERELCVGIF